MKIFRSSTFKPLYYQINQKEIPRLPKTCPLCPIKPILPLQDIGSYLPTRCCYQMTPRPVRPLGKGVHPRTFCIYNKQASPFLLSGIRMG
jgi:hypothetical protein